MPFNYFLNLQLTFFDEKHFYKKEKNNQLPVEKTMNNQYEIIYNLEYYSNFAFLPSAFVTTRNEEGKLTYIQRKVSADTLENYGDDFAPIHRRLLEIVDSLQITPSEKKYNLNNRRKKTIVQLIENKAVKANIIQYIGQRLSTLLDGINRNGLHLCMDARRKDWIKDISIGLSRRPLFPDLNFVKKSDGISYQMRLSNGEFTWKLSNREIQVITNTPAWIIINRRLFHVLNINGNMVKPFRKKDEVFINQSFVKEYFQKFILKIVSKATINAEGFDIIQYKTLKKTVLSFRHNFMTKEYALEIQFDYEKAQFGIEDKQRDKTSLDFKGEEITIHQARRSRLLETERLDYLKSLGLEAKGGKYLKLEGIDHKTPYGLLEWLILHSEQLKERGFEVEKVDFEEKTVVLSAPTLQLNLKQFNDWFDIHGVIEIEGFTIPFYALAQYIRQYIRLYPLPNGSFFLIPEEWMERYQALFQLAKVRKNGLQLNKSQFPILKKLKFDKAEEELQETLQQDFSIIDYSPPKTLKATLRPYQKEGIKWLIHLYHNQLGACLADDMGLGKTLQTIAMLLYAKEQKTEKRESTNTGKQLNMFGAHQAALDDFSPLNAMVILPASLVFNWEEEIRKFAPQLTIYKHIGAKRNKKAALLYGFDVMLTTYHTALRDIDLLQDLVFEYIVLDESQQIKNKDSKIFKAINRLQANHKISLSGTPIENSLSDLWSQMQFINPELLGGFTFFKKAFIAPIERKQDEAQKERLKSLIAPYMLRRTKESVAKDLPSLTEQVFYSEMSDQQRKLYEREKSAARNHILDNYGKGLKFSNIVLNTLMKLRQIANHPLLASEEYNYKSGKFNDIIHHLETIQKGGHKTLIFSQFVTHLELFKQHFHKENWQYSWLTGKNTSKQRQQSIKDFQSDEAIKAFLISLKAGGTGLNLTAADYVFITDPWWNPSAERQAIARAHRIGQTKNVIAIKFITKDTIEEKILKLQERKRQLAEDIIESNDKIQFSKKDLAFLLE